jgi:hypothetical protein
MVTVFPFWRDCVETGCLEWNGHKYSFRFSFLCFPLVWLSFHRTVWNCRESVQDSIGYIAV